MKKTMPPALARWMLHHLLPGESNEALAGDLHEEFRSGRSAAWYWRQVFSAISIRCTRELRIHRTVLLFAALWAMLAPAWLLTIARIEQFAHLSHRLAQFNWPWSSLGSFALMLVANLVFLWAGIALYLFPDLWFTGNLRSREFIRGIAASLPVLLVLWLALIVLPMHFVVANTTQSGESLIHSPMLSEAALLHNQSVWARYDHQLDLRQSELREHARAATATPARSGTIDLRPSTMLMRLPFFIVVLCSLWPSARRNHLQRELINM